MGQPSATIALLEAGRLRVLFTRDGDRVGHRVELLGDDGEFRSELIAADAAGDWPRCPPFQQVHLEERGEATVALLVGMAGSSHWSAAITAEPSAESVTFDIACRVKGPPEWLGTEYEQRCASAGRLLTLRVQTGRQETYTAENAPLAILPADDPSPKYPKTLRWVYQISAGEGV